MSTQNSKNRPTPTQARAARRERRQNRRKFTRVFIGLAIGGVALLLILGLILPMLGNLGGSSDKTPNGPGKQIESDGRDHIEEGSQHRHTEPYQLHRGGTIHSHLLQFHGEYIQNIFQRRNEFITSSMGVFQ